MLNSDKKFDLWQIERKRISEREYTKLIDEALSRIKSEEGAGKKEAN